MAKLRTVHTPTIQYGYIAYFGACLQHLGIPADRLALDAGHEPQTLVPLKQMWDLWESARTATGQTGWGVRVAELLPPRAPGLIQETLEASVTLVEALTVLTHASSVINKSGRLTLSIDSASTFFELHFDYPEVIHPEGIEQSLAFFVSVLWPSGTRPDFTTHLRHNAPADTAPQLRAFGPNVHYRSERNGLSFDTATLLKPRVAEAAVPEIRRTVAAVLTARPPDDIVGQVDQVIGEQLAGRVPAITPTIDSVAAQLGLHAKNLNRQLAAHDTTFRALLDAHRHKASLTMLDRPLSVQQIAARLGYSDPAAFVRAFRRWTGISPTAHRARLPVSAPDKPAGADVIPAPQLDASH